MHRKFLTFLVILVLLVSSMSVSLPFGTLFGQFNFIPTVKAQEPIGNPILPEIETVNWTRFWELFNAHSDWDLEYNTGSGWKDIKSDLQIIKDYRVFIDDEGWVSVNRSAATICKITLNFTASYTANYRLTFGIDLDVKNYTYKGGSWNYTITYQDYTVCFDWSDIKSIPNLIITHGIKPVEDESWFWFRIRKDDVQQGKNVVIDPSFGYGSIGVGGTKSIENTIVGSVFTNTENGTADSIWVALKTTTSYAGLVKCAIYKHSDLSLVGETPEGEVELDGTAKFYGPFDFAGTKPSIYENIEYILMAWGESNAGTAFMVYNVGSTDQGHHKTTTYDGFPNPLVSPTHTTNKFSIYCNYTVPAPDTKAPTYSNVGTNTTIAGQPCLFYTKWTDEIGLDDWGFGTNNTGPWVWEEWTKFTTNPDWSNATKTLNTTVGVRVEFRIFARDTSGNLNDTGEGPLVKYLITTSAKAWHDVLTWTSSLATRAWSSGTSWTTNLIARTWSSGTSFSLNLLTRQNVTVASWLFDFRTRIWVDIAKTWTFDWVTMAWESISWIFYLGTSIWTDIATWGASLVAMMWNDIATHAFNLLTMAWHDLTWLFNLLPTIVWNDVAAWVFSLSTSTWNAVSTWLLSLGTTGWYSAATWLLQLTYAPSTVAWVAVALLLTIVGGIFFVLMLRRREY